MKQPPRSCATEKKFSLPLSRRRSNCIVRSAVSCLIWLRANISKKSNLSRRQAIKEAGISFQDLDAVAVTQGPGLIGSLLVGVNFAKALAWGLDIPFVGVNHIEGHVYSVAFENPPIEYPALALIVSGGHTNLFFVPEEGKYKVVSRTRDDAAGEAFDKVGKMLGLEYPGGPVIEKLAREGDAE